MGCFFGCFRVKDGDRPQPNLVSAAGSSKFRDPLVPDNRLASLLSREDDTSPSKDAEKNYSQSVRGDMDGEIFYSELKDEAKFLKSCGTLLETPAEIRKVSEKMRVLPHDGSDASAKFHSWLPGSSGKRLLWEEQPDHVPPSPVKLHDEAKASINVDSPDHKSRSCVPEQQKQTRTNCTRTLDGDGFEAVETAIGIPVHLHNKESLPSVTPELPIVTTEWKKCVRFECDPSENDSHKCMGSDSGTQDGNELPLGMQQSPYPTPLRLTEEMQTPGTVFPAKLENLATGKNARIRSQYVYPVLNPIENSSQWNALKGSDDHQLGSSGEGFELCKDTSSEFLAKTPMCYRAAADGLLQNENSSPSVDSSLSDWLKPASVNDDRGRLTFVNRKSPSGRSSDMDRPILGTVAAHWNDDEPAQIVPKWWDGNGIPNSTNKYKEDQKVSWHATPFEERLEKALSDEKLFPQKNPLTGRPIDFEDNEETDTADSRFQVPTHLESAVQS